MSWFWILALAALVILNGIASVRLVASQSLSPPQRAAPLLLVWLVPAVGAIVTLSFLTTDTLHDTPSIDRTAFIDNADAVDGSWNAPPGESICGCSGSASGDGGGDGD